MTPPIDPKFMEMAKKPLFWVGLWDRIFPSKYFIDSAEGIDLPWSIYETKAEAEEAAQSIEIGYEIGLAQALDSVASPKTMNVSRESVLSAVCNACPNCLGAGFTVHKMFGRGYDDESECWESHQEQCQWCDTEAEKATDEIMKLLEGSK